MSIEMEQMGVRQIIEVYFVCTRRECVQKRVDGETEKRHRKLKKANCVCESEYNT